jgi:hypothetical protein
MGSQPPFGPEHCCTPYPRDYRAAFASSGFHAPASPPAVQPARIPGRGDGVVTFRDDDQEMVGDSCPPAACVVRGRATPKRDTGCVPILVRRVMKSSLLRLFPLTTVVSEFQFVFTVISHPSPHPGEAPRRVLPLTQEAPPCPAACSVHCPESFAPPREPPWTHVSVGYR